MEAEKLDGYGKSKVMAEKAAWEYVKELPGKSWKMEIYCFYFGGYKSQATCLFLCLVKPLSKSFIFLGLCKVSIDVFLYMTLQM